MQGIFIMDVDLFIKLYKERETTKEVDRWLKVWRPTPSTLNRVALKSTNSEIVP